MKKKGGIGRIIGAVITTLCFVFLVLVIDYILTSAKPVENSQFFWKNDYDIILDTYGTSEFDKAFFGNSAVIASYIDTASDSGYINIGIDYGKVRDIYEMLRGGFITVNDELVIGLNMFCFLDTLDTNPSYPWFRKPYEPYLYFQRDKLYPFISEGFERVLRGEDFVKEIYENPRRMLYYGILDDEELQSNIKRQRENYWNQGIENYDENFRALEELMTFCKNRGINLRAVWMPWNSKVTIPDIEFEIQNKADGMFAKGGVEVLNMKDAVNGELFHDIGHLEYTVGSPYFTELISPWLAGGELYHE